MKGFIRIKLKHGHWVLGYGQFFHTRIVISRVIVSGSYLKVTEMAQVLQVHLLENINGSIEERKAEL